MESGLRINKLFNGGVNENGAGERLEGTGAWGAVGGKRAGSTATPGVGANGLRESNAGEEPGLLLKPGSAAGLILPGTDG